MECVLPIKEKSTNASQIGRAYTLCKQVEVIVKCEAASMINLFYPFAYLVCVVEQGFYFIQI